MTRRYAVGIGVVLVVAIVAAYWESANYSAEHLLSAFAARDATAVAAEVNWAEVIPALARDVATSFPDPNAQHLSSLVEGTYKSNLLRIVRTSKVAIHATSAGFTNIDEYTVVTSSGNQWILSRHGLRWIVDRLLPTPENAQKIGIVAIATADPNASLNLHARDIYFGSAQFGCRLTSTADVTNFDSSPELIAFVRTSETGHTQLWLLHQDTLKIELAVDGKEPEKFAGPSTEGQNSLTFSRDGRYLYFTADAWATSSAIMELDINTKKTRFVAAANGVRVIEQGRHAGNLLAVQNRHHAAPEFGLYEQAVVIDSQGNELAYVDGDSLTSTLDHENHELPRARQKDEQRSIAELMRIVNDAQ